MRAEIAFLKTEGLAGCYQGELRGFDEVAVPGMCQTGCGNGERQETPEELQDSKIRLGLTGVTCVKCQRYLIIYSVGGNGFILDGFKFITFLRLVCRNRKLIEHCLSRIIFS